MGIKSSSLRKSRYFCILKILIVKNVNKNNQYEEIPTIHDGNSICLNVMCP